MKEAIKMGSNQFTSKEKLKENFEKKLNAAGKFKLVGSFFDKECTFKCLECGSEFTCNRENILRRKYCPHCFCIKNSTKGKETISEKFPDLSKFFIDKNFPITHSCGTHKKAFFKCPSCGEIREVAVCYLLEHGLSCKRCGDGISFPNKFIYNVLKEANIKFISEKVFRWGKNKNNNFVRYDFYIPKFNMIIEANGLQHYKDTIYGNIADIIKNDEHKEKIAKMNGVVSYVRLDCSKSTPDFIINSIKNQSLLNFINFDSIDLNKIITNCSKSLLLDCCDIFNKNQSLSTTDISIMLNLDRHTVRNYLNRGAIAGLCVYNTEIAENIRKKKAAENRKKQSVLQFDLSNKFISRYDSVTIASEKTGIKNCAIRNCCVLISNTAGGFLWKYEDDAILKNIINRNIQKIRHCCDAYNKYLTGENPDIKFDKNRFRTYLKYGSVLGIINYNPEDTSYQIARVKNSRKKKVYQYSSNGLFINSYNCYEDAYKSTGINVCNIRNSVSQKTILGGGFIWTDGFNNEIVKEKIEKIKMKIAKSGKAIVQYSENGEKIAEFNSLSEAKLLTGVKTISHYLKGERKHAGGYMWKYKNEV